MTFLIKPIKPGKIKAKWIRLELLNALRREGTQDKKLLRKTVATWRRKPRFEKSFTIQISDKDKTRMTVPVTFGRGTGPTDKVKRK